MTKKHDYAGRSVSIGNCPPPMEKSRFSAVSRVFVLLLIALVAVGGLAGGVGADPVGYLNFKGGTLLDPQGTTGDNFPYGSGDLDISDGHLKLLLGGGNTPAQQSINLFPPNLVREGYSFKGWYDDEHGDTQVFNEDGFYVSTSGYLEDPQSSGQYVWSQNLPVYVNLTAHWKVNTTNIILDAEGGTFPAGAPTTGTISTDDSGITFNPNYMPPTRPGYSFGGWWAYDSGDYLSLIAEGSESAQELKLSSDIDGKDNIFKITWTDPDYTWTSLVGGETVTLHAAWSEICTCINFHPNGGNFTNEETLNKFIDDIVWNFYDYFADGGYIDHFGDTKIMVNNDYSRTQFWNLSVSHPDGLTFRGWTAVKDDPSTMIITTQSSDLSHFPIVINSYEDSAQYFKIENGGWYSTSLDPEPFVTLYAYWEPVQQNNNNAAAILSSTSKYRDSVPVEYCQVFFDANGGAGEMGAQQFTVGEPRELNLNLFTYEDRPFEGWALEPLGGVVYTDGEKITVNEDTTLYAVWGIEEIPDMPILPPEDEGIPTWVFVLIGFIIVAAVVGAVLYIFVFKRT